MTGRDAIAGAVGVGVTLGVVEFGAGLLGSVPSPVDALGQQVVARSPGSVLTWAIETLGSANRPVLAGTTVLIALLIGAVVGVAGRRAPVVPVVVGLLLGALALGASLARPDTRGDLVLLVLLVGLAGGLAVLFALLRMDGPVGEPAPVGMSADAAASGTGDDPGQATPTNPALARRSFFRLAAGAGAGAMLAGAVGRQVLSEASASWGPQARTLPEPAVSLGDIAAGTDLATTVEGVSPLLTPNADFYRIDTAIAVPQVDAATWSMRVHGLVERELRLTYDDLLARPLVEVDATIACVSNEVGGDLVGTARWLGVPLVDLLDEVGPRSDAEQVVGRSVDGWTAGFPLAQARDGRDALVAVAMNGEPLPVRHGYPARLVVPGLYGYVSATKWLSEIELTTWDGFDGYWVPRGWSKEGPVKTASRIDVPARNAEVTAGSVVVAGVAWAPTRGIDRVEVAVDDGPWSSASLVPPLSPSTWVQWHTTVALAPGDHRIAVRATDGTAALQSEGPQPPMPDGSEGWHRIRVTAA